jgi:predicted amidophosphoribosyltransferase
MVIRESARIWCPECGRPMKSGHCACGAVAPGKDNTFICKCGNVVDVDKPVCRKCGAVYEPTSITTTVFIEQK